MYNLFCITELNLSSLDYLLVLKRNNKNQYLGRNTRLLSLMCFISHGLKFVNQIDNFFLLQVGLITYINP